MLTKLICSSYNTNREVSRLIHTCGVDVSKECGPASYRVVHRDGKGHQHAYVCHGEHLEGLLCGAVQRRRDRQRHDGSTDVETPLIFESLRVKIETSQIFLAG